jgi:hypothetical protein
MNEAEALKQKAQKAETLGACADFFYTKKQQYLFNKFVRQVQKEQRAMDEAAAAAKTQPK